MPDWQPHEGATLLMPSGSQGDHLFVVLNDPKTFPGYGPHPCVVLVNLSTVQPDTQHDPTCLLQPGCHRFAKKESYVRYRSARIETVTQLSLGVRQGLFKPHDTFSGELLASIQNGLKASPFAKREFKLLVL